MRRNIVYIVDDDQSVRESLAFFLTTLDYSAQQFADPEAFVRASATLAPGCVLLDIRMPGIDGLEVLESLQQAREVLPVVVMTGHGDVTTAVRAMKLGACDFLEKPFDEDTLLDILVRTFASLDGAVVSLGRLDGVRVRLARLSQREREVLVSLLAGRPNKVIAHELDISVRTVEMHRAGMMARLGVRTLSEALRLAIEGDLLSVALTAEPLATMP
ncbi:MAG: response regulator [Sandarakinorhabdus sp.]|nr:response regulator [Sandarakinorhabdus sp.]